MTFKKIMLVASMAMAAVAFAAPAAQADAPEWWIHTGPETEETLQGEEGFRITGALSSNVVGSALVSGPCNVTLEGTASNVNGMASGTITSGTTTKTCQTPIPGCHFEPTLDFTIPWSVTGVTVTGEKGIEIGNAKFLEHYNATCQAYGIPPTVTFTGTMTALLDEEAPTGECITFEEHLDDMFINDNPLAPRVNILGTVCVDAPLTLH